MGAAPAGSGRRSAGGHPPGDRATVLCPLPEPEEEEEKEEEVEEFIEQAGFRMVAQVKNICHSFSKNDEVKREVGARFDGSRRKWYIPEECLCARNVEYCRSRGWLA